MTKQTELLQYLFDGKPHSLSPLLLAWMDASTRFTIFVDTYRDKIRKKIRVTREAESVQDLRAELETAYRLLNDRRLAIAYEPYASAKRRGPDFAVTYRTNLVFNIEVTHLRGDLDGNGSLGQKEERIMRILMDKLGQMQPGMANLLVIHTGADLAQAVDLARLMQTIKTRVEGKDPAFFAAARYPNPAAFYKDFLHLSGILLWAGAPQLWINKPSRPALDEKVLRLVSSLAVAVDKTE